MPLQLSQNSDSDKNSDLWNILKVANFVEFRILKAVLKSWIQRQKSYIPRFSCLRLFDGQIFVWNLKLPTIATKLPSQSPGPTASWKVPTNRSVALLAGGGRGLSGAPRRERRQVGLVARVRGRVPVDSYSNYKILYKYMEIWDGSP